MPESKSDSKMIIELDCRGLFCPVPIIRTAQALRLAGPGAMVDLLADDPGVEGDMEDWSKGTGNRILNSSKDSNGVFRFRVQKKGADSGR